MSAPMSSPRASGPALLGHQGSCPAEVPGSDPQGGVTRCPAVGLSWKPPSACDLQSLSGPRLSSVAQAVLAPPGGLNCKARSRVRQRVQRTPAIQPPAGARLGAKTSRPQVHGSCSPPALPRAGVAALLGHVTRRVTCPPVGLALT